MHSTQEEKKKKKIVITGGHVTPALAFLEVIDRKNWDVYWIGEEKAVFGTKVKTLEYHIIPGLGIPFYKITSAKLERRFILRSIFSFWKILAGFFQSLFLLLRIKPDVLLSFGSYVSVPVALAAWILRIPIVIHEQTAGSGLANKIIAALARFVAISFEGSREYFPENKVVFTGNLVRKKFFEIGRKKKNAVLGEKPVIYITGGSRGSQVINDAVLGILSRLLKIACVYHQTGWIDFKKMKGAAQKLPEDLRGNYEIKATYSPVEVERIYSLADIVVSRSGANTVSELAASGTPSILIPIPWSQSGEQAKNAALLQRLGAVRLLRQEDLTPDKLFSSIEELIRNYDKYKKGAAKAHGFVFENASTKLLEAVRKAAGGE